MKNNLSQKLACLTDGVQSNTAAMPQLYRSGLAVADDYYGRVSSNLFAELRNSALWCISDLTQVRLESIEDRESLTAGSSNSPWTVIQRRHELVMELAG